MSKLDNATPHSAEKIKTWLEKYKWKVLQHLPHSPNLAPSDFFVWSIKKNLGEIHF